MISDLQRYRRQMILPEIGKIGQEKLKNARVLCVGAGGLGSPALLYLAAAGIGKLGIIDFDEIDVTNLQRQILFKTSDQGKLKTVVAKRELNELNPDTIIETYETALSTSNVIEVFRTYDVVLDGTDNFSAKYLINDAAVILGLPVIYGAISKFEGRLSSFWSKYGPCYRCLYSDPPQGGIQSCAEAGVLGALAGTIGTLQALEAIKIIISGAPTAFHPESLEPLIGRLLIFDARSSSFLTLAIQKDENCKACSKPHELKLTAIDNDCQDDPIPEVSPQDLRVTNDYEIIDVREIEEYSECHIPNATHLPLSTLTSNSTFQPQIEKRYILYCKSGIRSKRAAKVFKMRGAKNVQSLRGGIDAWSLLNT